MSELNKKNINYGGLNRFLQNLRSHDLSGLATEEYVDDAIAEIPEYSAGENIIIDEGIISTDGYLYNASLGAISLPGYYKQGITIIENTDYPSRGEYELLPDEDFGFQDSYTSGMSIYDSNNLEVGIITTLDYEDSETIYCDIDFKDNYTPQAGDVYHINVPFHQLQNKNEVGLAGFTNSHKTNNTQNISGNTLLSIGLTRELWTSTGGNPVNALEVMGNGDLYIKGVGGYNGSETSAQLATKKTLQTVIGEKANASALTDKANKVDYVVQLNPMTQQYDWTSLNSVTETGVYRISIEVDMMGTVMKMGAGDLFVLNTAPTIIQSILIPSDDSIASHVRKSTNSGSSWVDSDTVIPSINDSATTSLTETYSIDKINSLISALDVRLTAMGG